MYLSNTRDMLVGIITFMGVGWVYFLPGLTRNRWGDWWGCFSSSTIQSADISMAVSLPSSKNVWVRDYTWVIVRTYFGRQWGNRLGLGCYPMHSITMISVPNYLDYLPNNKVKSCIKLTLVNGSGLNLPIRNSSKFYKIPAGLPNLFILTIKLINLPNKGNNGGFTKIPLWRLERSRSAVHPQPPVRHTIIISASQWKSTKKQTNKKLIISVINTHK